MSIPLPSVNLAGVSVGQSGIVSLNNVGVSAGGISANPADIQDAGILHIFNESGSGLLIQFQTAGSAFHLPAGGWVDKIIKAGEQGIQWTVLYNLPNPPVTLLLVTYYYPGEPLPRVPALGNSPIGIGGTVNTSSVSTLSNESNNSQTLIIDIGQVGHTLLITINSDGSFIWSVLQSGVAHQVMQARTTGKPLLLGQAGDNIEVANNLDIDNKLFVVGNTNLDNGNISTDGNGRFILSNNIPLQIKTTGGTATDTLYADNANGVDLQAISSVGVAIKNSSANSIMHFDSNGAHLDSGAVFFLTGQIARAAGANGTVCGSGTTITHGLGATPGILVATPDLAQAGSATVGVGNIGSTTFQATVGAGANIDWLALA